MSNKSIVPFQFEGKEIQAFIASDGEPRWIASGICKALGYTNISQTINTYVDVEDRGYIDPNAINIPPISPEYTPGSTLVVNESGLYALILGSSKPEAKRLKRLVTSEILPSLRKTGSYSVVAHTPAQQILMIAQHMVDLEQQALQTKLALEAHDDRLDKVEARQDVIDHFYTISAWANLQDKHPNQTDYQKLGKFASRYSKTHGFNIGHVPDQKYGQVNTYHEQVLEVAFEQWRSQWPLFDGDY